MEKTFIADYIIDPAKREYNDLLPINILIEAFNSIDIIPVGIGEECTSGYNLYDALNHIIFDCVEDDPNSEKLYSDLFEMCLKQRVEVYASIVIPIKKIIDDGYEIEEMVPLNTGTLFKLYKDITPEIAVEGLWRRAIPF